MWQNRFVGSSKRSFLLIGILLIMLILSVFSFSGSAGAHSGRTDSRGGHNCNVPPCAGTYHYHNSGGSYDNSGGSYDNSGGSYEYWVNEVNKKYSDEGSTIFESPWFWIIGIGGGIWLINKRSK